MPDHNARVLVIDASEALLDLLQADLFRLSRTVVAERADNAAAVETALHWFEPDLVVSDWSLPDLDGLQALRIVHRLRPGVPFVFVSDGRASGSESDAFGAGALDCLDRTEHVRLVHGLQRALDEALGRRSRREMERALQESEIRFRLFMEQIPVAVYMKDLEGRFTFVNPVTEHIIGKPAVEILGHKPSHFYSEAASQAYAENDARALLVRQPTEAIEYAPTSEGMRTFLSVKFPVTGVDGLPLMMGGVSMDITQRDQAQGRLARLHRIHAAVIGIGSAIEHARSRDSLLQQACQVAVDAGGVRMAWVGLADQGQSKVTPVAWHGADDGYLAEVGRLLELGDEEHELTGWSILVGSWDSGIAAEATRRSEAVVCDDIETDPRILFKPQALARGYRSMVALPLKIQGRAVGMMMLFAGESAFFDADVFGLLQAVATGISLALDRFDQAQRLDFATWYDPLTELPNRGRFLGLLTDLLRDRMAAAEEVTLLLFDLRRFADLNLQLGGNAGDLVLRSFAARLGAMFGGTGTVGRLGADCFAAAIRHAKASSPTVLLDDRWDERLTGPISVGAAKVRPQFSLGISSSSSLAGGGADAAEKLLLSAEAALHRAKRSGAGSPNVSVVATRERSLEPRLRDALANAEFVLHYQPKVELATRMMVGVEATILWRDHGRKLMPPAEFVPVLEYTGLIVEVGQWALTEVERDTRRWQACSLKPPRVSLTVAPVQLRQPDFVAKVLASLGGAPRAAELIDLEIARHAWIDNVDEIGPPLKQLRDLGVGIVMGGFGSACLSLLAQLPVTCAKIDSGLVLDIGRRPSAQATVAAIVGVANALGIVTLADGVHSEKTAQQLLQLGCHQAQGALFGMPRAAGELDELLALAPGDAVSRTDC